MATYRKRSEGASRAGAEAKAAEIMERARTMLRQEPSARWVETLAHMGFRFRLGGIIESDPWVEAFLDAEAVLIEQVPDKAERHAMIQQAIARGYRLARFTLRTVPAHVGLV